MRARRVEIRADGRRDARARAAVLEELERTQPDSVAHCGDLTRVLLRGEVAVLAGRDALIIPGSAGRSVADCSVTAPAVRLQARLADTTPREPPERRMMEQRDAPTRAPAATLSATTERDVDEVLPNPPGAAEVIAHANSYAVVG